MGKRKIPPTEPQTPAWLIKKWPSLLLIATVVAIIYLPSLKYELTYFDDDAILLQNEQRLDSLSMADAFLTDAEFSHDIDLYRPLANLSFLLDYRVWGFEPGPFHLTGLLLHLMNAFLVLLILRKLGKPGFWPLIAALLFASHPLFGITTAWLPARGDLFLGTFSLLSFYAMIHYADTGRMMLLLLSLLAAVLAVFSKETALVLPLIFAFWYFVVRKKKASLSYFLIHALVLGLGYGLYFWLRSLAIHPLNSGVFGFNAFFQNLRIFPEALWFFVFPYEAPVFPFYTWLPTLGGLLILLILVGVWFKFKDRRRELAFAYGWFVIFSLPATFYRPEWSAWCYEYCLHRSYLPLMGLFFIAATGLVSVSPQRSKWLKSAMIGVVIFLTAYSVWSVRIFSDDLSLFAQTTRTNPASALAWQNHGNALFRQAKFSQARESYQKALVLKPDLTDAWMNLGVSAAKSGSVYLAILTLEKVAQLNPNHRQANEMLAGIYFSKGRYAESAHCFRKIIDSDRRSPASLKKYAYALVKAGMLKEAIEAYKELIKLEPSAENYSNLGFVLLDDQEAGQALEQFELALELQPENADALLGEVIAYYTLGNLQAARSVFIHAMTIEPRLKQGMIGIQQMQSDGYFFSKNQLDQLEIIFTSFL